MECYLCGSKKTIKRKGHPRDNKLISILECSECGLVFLDNFDHIDENFYQESNMHNDEFQSNSIKEWLEETEIDDIRRIEQHKSKIKNKKILDFGCGAGGFLKRAKSFANKVKGIELDKKVKKYWEGIIEIDSTLEETINSKDLFDVITLFHVLEHIKDPITLLKNISKSIDRKGEIIIEVPSSDDALLTLYDCEPFQKFSYWSNHLFLYNNNTLRDLIEKSGLKVKSIQNYQRYSLSNHLYWLSKGKPNGHNKWSFLNSSDVDVAYSKSLEKIQKTDTLIAYACI